MTHPTSLNAPFPIGELEFVALMAALTATSSLAIDCLLPALPGIGASLHVTNGNQLQVLVSVFVIGSAAGAIFAGPIADRFGRKPTLAWATLFFALAAMACGLMQSFAALVMLRFVQGLCAAAMSALPMSVVRDRYAGDRMARTMSLVSFTFMFVPVIAPTLGQLAFVLVGWRWLFAILGSLALLTSLWVTIRLPETLAKGSRRPMNPLAMAAGWASIVRNRKGFGYILAQSILMGAIYGYVVSGQQIVGGHFGQPKIFGIVFGIISLGMMAASLTNSRIVMRFGSRAISRVASLLFVLMSVVMICMGRFLPHSLPAFVIGLMICLSLIGLCSSNFGAISMQGFGHLAGSASGFLAFMRLGLGGLIGAIIGHFYDGTTVPLGVGYLVCGLAVLACVRWAESGRAAG